MNNLTLKAMKKDNVEERRKIDAILRILEDHYPNSISKIEIASLVNLPTEKVDSFLAFLAKYSFIAYDEKEKKAVIRADFSSL